MKLKDILPLFKNAKNIRLVHGDEYKDLFDGDIERYMKTNFDVVSIESSHVYFMGDIIDHAIIIYIKGEK